MARSHNQKIKILLLEKMLQNTDENHVVTMQEILDSLAEYEIPAERKSIYDDMEALRVFGLDIKYHRGRPGGYYVVGGQAVKDQKTLPAKPKKETPVQTRIIEEKVYHGYSKKEIRDTEKTMKLNFSASRKKDVQSYFGKLGEYKEKEDHMTVNLPSIAGPEFFGWLTSMGKDVYILKPKKTAAAYRDYLKSLAKEYKGI